MSAIDPTVFARPHIRDLEAYVPGEQPQGDGWTKLNTNENPYPPSPKVGEAILAEISQLRRYPEPLSIRLRRSIARRFAHSAEGVIIGNGSDDLLNLIAATFAADPGVGHTVPSYSLYPVVAGLANQGMIDVPFTPEMRLDSAAIARSGAGLFFLTSPNAPTGVGFSLDAIRGVLNAVSGMLVVDEAYVDFGGESAAPLLREFPNLIIVRTFSKSYGLAGLRVGFALADPAVIALLDKVRDVYNVDRLAQAGALAAFEDEAYFEQTRNVVIETRQRVRQVFDGWGWFTYPSAANFLFTRPRSADGSEGPEVAAALFRHLTESRVLIRYFGKHPLTAAFLRISIGTDAEMDRFIAVTNEWLQNSNQLSSFSSR